MYHTPGPRETTNQRHASRNVGPVLDCFFFTRTLYDFLGLEETHAREEGRILQQREVQFARLKLRYDSNVGRVMEYTARLAEIPYCSRHPTRRRTRLMVALSRTTQHL
jgi:hypothetical protein